MASNDKFALETIGAIILGLIYGGMLSFFGFWAAGGPDARGGVGVPFAIFSSPLGLISAIIEWWSGETSELAFGIMFIGSPFMWTVVAALLAYPVSRVAYRVVLVVMILHFAALPIIFLTQWGDFSDFPEAWEKNQFALVNGFFFYFAGQVPIWALLIKKFLCGWYTSKPLDLPVQK
jgi:hypothetical protein